MAKTRANKSKRIYESLLLLDAGMTKERQNEIIALVQKTCEQFGGRVIREVFKGRRRLSYSIGSRTEGQYLTLYYEAFPAVNEALRKALQYHEDIIRSQTLVVESVPGTPETGGPDSAQAEGAPASGERPAATVEEPAPENTQAPAPKEKSEGGPNHG